MRILNREGVEELREMSYQASLHNSPYISGRALTELADVLDSLESKVVLRSEGW